MVPSFTTSDMERQKGYVSTRLHRSFDPNTRFRKENALGKNFYVRNGFMYVSEKDDDEEWYMEKRLGAHEPSGS
jgi:hypothetical protein